MRNELNLLVVAANSEHEKLLLGVSHGLPVYVHSAAKIEEAQEVLSRQEITIIFCERHLSDGPYRELLSLVRSRHAETRFVVVLSAAEWPEKQEALKLGASDVLRYPLTPVEVELVLLRTVREQLEKNGFKGFEEQGCRPSP